MIQNCTECNSCLSPLSEFKLANSIFTCKNCQCNFTFNYEKQLVTILYTFDNGLCVFYPKLNKLSVHSKFNTQYLSFEQMNKQKAYNILNSIIKSSILS